MSETKSPVFPQEPGQASRDVKMIVDLFTAAAPTDTVSYSEIEDAIGSHDNGGDNRIQRAVKRARKQGVNMECIAGVGYQRCSSSETVATVPRHIKRVRRAAHRTIERLATVETKDLSNNEKTEFLMQQAVMGAASAVTGSRHQETTKQRLQNGRMKVDKKSLGFA